MAEEPDKTYTLEQLSRFLAAVADAGGSRGLLLHAANSAATIELPQTHLDMVRVGLALYGYQPGRELQTRLPLQPALRVLGRLMQVRDVPAGTRCGYGLLHEFKRPSRIGLVPMGYADGYLRSLSNRSVVGVGGKLVQVCGRVSMDQITVDLTEVPEATIGTAVEIISSQPHAPHSVEGLARLAGTIPYEITVRLGARVHRRLQEQQPEAPNQRRAFTRA